VADFVGADRALKSLSLTRLEEIDLLAPPLVRVGEPVSGVRERIAGGSLAPVAGHVLVADEIGRPLDWLPMSRLGGADTVPERPSGGAEPIIDRVTTLRDALSAIIEADSAYGTVVNGNGRCVGLVGAAQIASGLRHSADEAASEGAGG
jgi:osmoprotectant transport system ATP-binding protein